MGIIHRIIDDLGKMPFFEDAKYSKNTMRFMWKTEWGYRSVVIGRSHYLYVTYVEPYYNIKFDVLLKWLKKYDLKYFIKGITAFSVGFSPFELNEMDAFKKDPVKISIRFRTDGIGYEEQFNKLYREIVRSATYVFETYGTLTKMYNQLIEPVLNGTEEDIRNAFRYFNGIQWMFDYLTLCMIVAPENYPALKKIVFKKAESMRENGDYVMRLHYDRLGDIFDDFETNFAPKILKDKSKLPL